MYKKGKCKHGDFDLDMGCEKCIAERVAEEMPKKIVKVQYYSDDGRLSDRPYTYFSAEPLEVGDIVTVPVRDTTCKAQVSAVDVPEAEIVNFKALVKTIPAQKAQPKVDYSHPAFSPDPNAWRTGDEEVRTEEPDYDKMAEESIFLNETATTGIILRPGEDLGARQHYEQGLSMLKKAESMTAKTMEESKLVTADLALIGTLKRTMEAKRKEKLAPHQTIVKDIQETYKFLMEPVLEAERILKGLQVSFLQEQARIQQEQMTLNRKKMELAEAEMKLNGEMSQPVDLVEVQEAPKHVRTEMGTSGLVDHWTYEVTDFALLPDAYKVADTAQLTAIARGHHDKKQVPGVRFFNEPFLSTRR